MDDPELRAVSERAVRNYLAGERRNLAADLADGASSRCPSRRLTVDERRVDHVGRRGDGWRCRCARPKPDGATWTLRYELAVVRRERWYVRSLQVNPRSKGVS